MKPKAPDFNAAVLGLILDPAATAGEVSRSERLTEGILIYAASLAAAVAFYASMPDDLPAEFYKLFKFLVRGGRPLAFWAGTAASGTVLFLVELAALRLFTLLLGGKTTFLRLLGLFCWVHLFYLVMFIGMQGAVVARSAEATYLVEMTFTLWSLYVAVVGVRAVSGLSLPRSFGAVVLSSLVAVAVLFGAHSLGIVGKEQLSALAQF